jgi:hypothetical protein
LVLKTLIDPEKKTVIIVTKNYTLRRYLFQLQLGADELSFFDHLVVDDRKSRLRQLIIGMYRHLQFRQGAPDAVGKFVHAHCSAFFCSGLAGREASRAALSGSEGSASEGLTGDRFGIGSRVTDAGWFTARALSFAPIFSWSCRFTLGGRRGSDDMFADAGGTLTERGFSTGLHRAVRSIINAVIFRSIIPPTT